MGAMRSTLILLMGATASMLVALLNVDIGFQFAGPVGTNGFESIIQTGINCGAKYIEFYESDLTNSGNAGAIDSAHNALLAAP